MTRFATSPGRPADPDARLFLRARSVLTVQIAATVTVVLLLVGAVALSVMVADQHREEGRTLTLTAGRPVTAEQLPCVWMYQRRDGVVRGTPGAPPRLPVVAAMDRAQRLRRTLTARYRVGGIDYLVRTLVDGGTVTQIALDLRYDDQERADLYLALAISELVGLAAAAVTGRLLSRRAMAPLDEALKRQRRFVADASHELRTPLTQLHTRAQLLRRRVETGRVDPLAARRELDCIVASSRQLGEIVEDLLRSAQLSGDPRSYEPVDLATLAEQVALAESARADTARVTITVANETVPAGRVVNGVEPALRRAVAALVDNALRHSSAGGRVGLTVRPHGAREVALAVEDDGAGFPPDQAERIFERAQHGDRGRGAQFGIGLALAREIVESHRGSVTATGEPGRGATFTVVLPRAAAPRVAGNADAERSTARPSASRG